MVFEIRFNVILQIVTVGNVTKSFQDLTEKYLILIIIKFAVKFVGEHCH